MITKMSENPDYILEIKGIEDPTAAGTNERLAGQTPGGRKWIGIKFECCGIYARVYKNRAGTTYEGRCPRCLRKVEIGIGPGGTDQRMFRAM